MAKRVVEGRDEQTQRLYTAVGALVSPVRTGELEQLVQAGEGVCLSELERLRRGPMLVVITDRERVSVCPPTPASTSISLPG